MTTRTIYRLAREEVLHILCNHLKITPPSLKPTSDASINRLKELQFWSGEEEDPVDIDFVLVVTEDSSVI